ncbi:prealbumin-like fold domain-containing protein [Arthrobacter oryzae]|uniref:prealbumin-like fold domain-containing protein n=1 Tax=Arthrobacter oryzae TaxID=409290 RepID=UPI00273C7AF1|nr:prealbumin-like fold domain-containing protein [Arthrobacter oryzae]WLQ05984.1 prealbumin-like fold domain-containing protein [Arthrobacter oryzae]
MVLLLSGTTAAQANLAGSSFDAGDGNLIVNDEAQDWASIGIVCPPGTVLGCGIDKPTGQTDDSFGNGTKEDDAVPTVIDGSIPNNKSDLLRFYTRLMPENGDDFLYLAWERVQEPNGTTNMDFEFNKSKDLSDNGVTPVRSAGDVLIKYDLSQGGVNPVLGYHLWVTSGDPRVVCQASNTVPCWDKVHTLTGFFEGSINTAPVTDPIAPNAPRTLSTRTFGEAAINLTDAGLIPSGACLPFASAYLKSRSSDSFTSAVKDFIAPISAGESRCGTINVIKQDDDSPASALQGAVFTLYKDNAPVGGTLGTEDTPVVPETTCTTGADGKCSFANIPVGNYWVVETTTPAGHDTADPQQAVVGAGGTVALTFINPRDFKVIVLVCKEADNSLYPSTVTVDGADKTSLAAAPSGLTAAQLCGLGGAAYGDLSYGDHPANVNIPQ